MKNKKRNNSHVSPVLRSLFSYVSILIGAFIIAVSFNLFLLPNKIASGGVSGISIILNTLTAIPPAYTQWAFNIPLVHCGYTRPRQAIRHKDGCGLYCAALIRASHLTSAASNS